MVSAEADVLGLDAVTNHPWETRLAFWIAQLRREIPNHPVSDQELWDYGRRVIES